MKWEYLETYKPHELEKLGREGWELVAVTRVDDGRGNSYITYYFKRPIIGE